MPHAERRITAVIPTFEDGARAVEAVHALLSQRIDDAILDVLVVDDGSRADTVRELATLIAIPRTRIVTLNENAGRSAARNRGVAEAHGDYVLFMDCDCLPAGTEFVARHLAMLEIGHVASCGDIAGPDDSFWSRYQERASTRRRQAFINGRPYMGTSQNLAVRKSAFLAAGGFDPTYRQYGFEDRDLLLRMTDVGSIGWADQASVIHRDTLELSTVLRKLREAGASGSTFFRASHPEAYRALGYGRIDTRESAGAKFLAKAAGTVAAATAPLIDRMATQGWLPFGMAAALVRLTSAAAYAQGTADTRHSSP